MPAAPLIQLVATGQIDEYLTFNPQLSYFKYVYKRHTRFAIDSLKLYFDGKSPILSNSEDKCRIKIPRHGDLLSDLHLVLKMPDIYSNNDVQFRWIENFGPLLIKEANIYIGSLGRALNTIYGEWMLIWNELTLSPDKKYKYNKIVGNTEDYLNPRQLNPVIKCLRNSNISYNSYPTSTNEIPSITSKTISIPLQFYFCKNPALAIPLCALQTSEVIIQIEIEDVEKLYQIKHNSQYVSPNYYNNLNNTNININTFVKTNDLYAYIETQYIYLNENERKLITVNRRNNIFLIEEIEKRSLEMSEITKNIELDLNTPVKEIIWTMKTKNYKNYNTPMNYTDNGNHIMKSAKILWNKSNERVQDKDTIFYGKIQPYQHHTSIPKDGIYCYSFSLYPEKWQPSGYYNPGGKYPINTILQITRDVLLNNLDFYYIDVYIIKYNIFEIIGGMGGFKFT